MDLEKLEAMAAAGEEVPDGLSLPDTHFYICLRELYYNFRSGTIDKEQGKREKRKLQLSHSRMKSDCDILDQHRKIRKRMADQFDNVYRCKCQECQRMIMILDGLDRRELPEDLNEIYKQNERLRELIRERSERNGELATFLDRISWAAADGDLEKIKSIIEEWKK